MTVMHSHFQNQLLAAIPPAEFARLAPDLELLAMPVGQVLCESGAPLHYAYFPTGCILSLQYLTKGGSSIEIAGIGREGMLGIPLFLGGNNTPGRAFVRTDGEAYRIKAAPLKREFERGGKTMRLLLRYTHARLTQTSLNLVCNRLHSTEQKFCRQLLVTLDRTASDELKITQELLGSMLGVRREGITEAAGNLQKLGLIHYHRGHIKVIDRAGLERMVCDCYEEGKKEFDRLMLPVTQNRPNFLRRTGDRKVPAAWQGVTAQRAADEDTGTAHSRAST